MEYYQTDFKFYENQKRIGLEIENNESFVVNHINEAFLVFMFFIVIVGNFMFYGILSVS